MRLESMKECKRNAISKLGNYLNQLKSDAQWLDFPIKFLMKLVKELFLFLEDEEVETPRGEILRGIEKREVGELSVVREGLLN